MLQGVWSSPWHLQVKLPGQGLNPSQSLLPTLSLGSCGMISHQLSWRGEAGVENLQAGAFFQQATEILGLFWAVWEQAATCLLLAGSTGMFRAVMCCAPGKQLWVFVGIWAPSDIPRVGDRAVPASLGRAEGCPTCCCVTGQQTGLGCPWQVGVPSLLSHPRGN